MKNLKVLLVFTLILGGFLYVNAQKVVNVYPRHGTVVTKVYRPNIVQHRGVSFHYSRGIWYKPRGTRYVVCAAPRGIKVRFLPVGYRTVRINGRKFYRYNGVTYKRSGRFYRVVYV